jgi:hypothetical protein
LKASIMVCLFAMDVYPMSIRSIFENTISADSVAQLNLVNIWLKSPHRWIFAGSTSCSLWSTSYPGYKQ